LPIECLTGFSVFAVIVGAAYAADAYRRAARLQSALASAELRSLKAQLHPHFLFNTLHTISVLMDRDVALAKRLLVRLSELLRVALDTHGASLVPLDQEIRFAEHYLEIEHTRFQERLLVRIEVDPALRSVRVPSFLLQPLIENAVRHGIARVSGPGQLTVKVRRDDNRMSIEVWDSGPGSSSPSATGVGLANLRGRLEQLYGTNFELVASNGPNGGFLARVILPFEDCR
jgi:two-component system LytT family sensor kinase